MNIAFPVSPEAVLTVVGAAIVAALIAQWVKQYMGDTYWVPLIVLGLTEAICIAAVWTSTGAFDRKALFEASMLGFSAASLAVFGYELIFNLLGKAGIGPRSEEAREAKAREMLAEVGYQVTKDVAKHAGSQINK
jgi:hypothetical protein